MAEKNNIALQERSVFECYMFYYNCASNTNVYTFTSCDEEITLVIDGHDIVFSPGNLQRSTITRGSNETSDQVSITAAIDTTIMQQLVENRVSIGLSLKIFSVYVNNEQSSYTDDDYYVEFWGEATGTGRKENTITVSFEGWNGKLKNTQVPKILFSRTAQQALYRLCTFKLNREDFTFPGQITSISSDRYQITVQLDGSESQIEDTFTAGLCLFTTAPNDVTINKDDAQSDPSIRVITLLEKVPLGIVVGEVVNLSWGCDNSFNGVNGYAKFSNWENYDGIPYVLVTDATSELLG